jgi:hypothetical protein
MRRVDSSTSKSRLDRIGMVVFLSTTPCVKVSSLRSSALLVENSIKIFPQEEVYSSSSTVHLWKTYETLTCSLLRDDPYVDGWQEPEYFSEVPTSSLRSTDSSLE